MIDSHCHLNFPSIRADIKNIIKRCEANGVIKLLTINTNPDEFDDHLNLIKDFDNIYIAYGIHPDKVMENTYLSFADVENRIKNYYPDFLVKLSTGKTWLVEVKPAQEYKQPPAKPKRKTKKALTSYEYLMKNYLVNKSKFKSAFLALRVKVSVSWLPLLSRSIVPTKFCVSADPPIVAVISNWLPTASILNDTVSQLPAPALSQSKSTVLLLPVKLILPV